MGEVIILSSDDEGSEVPFLNNFKNENLARDSLKVDLMQISFNAHQSPLTSTNFDVKSLESQSLCKTVPRSAHTLSDSDTSEEEDISPNQQEISLLSSDEELPDIQIPLSYKTDITPGPPSVVTTNIFCHKSGEPSNQETDLAECAVKKKERSKNDEEKKRKKFEIQAKREEKKREMAYSKALKQAKAEVERNKKPGQCLQLTRSIIDPALLKCEFSNEIITALQAAKLRFDVEESLIPCSISWERTLQDVHDDQEKMMAYTTETIEKVDCVLVVWMWDKLIDLIRDGSLQATVKEIKSIYSSLNITLIICGLEEYFRFRKTQKTRDVRAKVLGTDGKKPKGKEGAFAAAGEISRGDVELSLSELQVLFGISHRIVNSKTDLSNIVCQFTKAIAEAPFKKENKATSIPLDWFASVDSLKGVAVDKDGKGSFRLWQQQLCQFNLASLETSEAIVSVYPSPLSLINAYKTCSSVKDAELLLQDIPVRRGPGPLSSTRRIGPQLSKKIYKFFSSSDGDDSLS